jgi:ribosomal-protein-alanine N-acetyltransferase
MTTFTENNFRIFDGVLPQKELSILKDWDQKYFPHPWPVDAWPTDFKNYLFYFYYLNNQPIALACFKITDIADPAHLLKLLVLPAQRGEGLGKIFFLKCLSDLKARGILNCFLEVSTQNPEAVRLYQKCGFHEFNQISRFYSDGSSAITMGNYQ